MAIVLLVFLVLTAGKAVDGLKWEMSDESGFEFQRLFDGVFGWTAHDEFTMEKLADNVYEDLLSGLEQNVTHDCLGFDHHSIYHAPDVMNSHWQPHVFLSTNDVLTGSFKNGAHRDRFGSVKNNNRLQNKSEMHDGYYGRHSACLDPLCSFQQHPEQNPEWSSIGLRESTQGPCTPSGFSSMKTDRQMARRRERRKKRRRERRAGQQMADNATWILRLPHPPATFQGIIATTDFSHGLDSSGSISSSISSSSSSELGDGVYWMSPRMEEIEASSMQGVSLQGFQSPRRPSHRGRKQIFMETQQAATILKKEKKREERKARRKEERRQIGKGRTEKDERDSNGAQQGIIIIQLPVQQ